METEILIRNRQKRIRPDPPRIIPFLRKAVELAWPKAARAFHLPARPASVEISVMFANDLLMRELNRAHRGIDKTTDVLSFPQLTPRNPTAFRREARAGGPGTPEEAPLALGDIIVNLHQAARQASARGVGLDEEIRHLLLHGLLHLLGYDHEGGDHREARRMRGAHSDIERKLGVAEGRG